MPILMQDQIESYALTYDEVYSGFMGIATNLGELYVNGEFDKLKPQYKKYYKYLAKNIRKINCDVLIKSLSDSEGVISLVHPNELLKNKILSSQLAAMSCVFNDWQVFLRSDIKEITKAYVIHNLSKLENATQDQLSAEYSKLSLYDTALNIQLLKQIGLLPLNLNKKSLISFGAAHGQQELYATQFEPQIDTAVGKDDQLLVGFSAKSEALAHTILIDSDPFWGEYYKQINERQGDRVLAINEDLYAALDKMPETLQKESLELRDLVTIWRLENKALPDVKKFFSKLKNSITKTADFVVTIGAGNTDEEFSDRQSKLSEIFDFLKSKGMEPYRIVMHRGNRYEPIFGDLRYASHELLCCKLIANNL